MNAKHLITLVGALGLGLAACGGGETPTPEPEEPEEPEPEEQARPEGKLPSLLAVFSAFDMSSGKPVPQPAKLVILSTDGKDWFEETINDESSNVFHKAMPWRDGILTIGATKANLKHWTRTDEGWEAETLWSKSWGGKFDRLRDIEIDDVDGDGADEIVLATHDQGVVAVGDEDKDAWTFTELSQKPDTFVHEIEIGDLDGDGKKEFYTTPSDRNRASGVSQPGEVVRYVYDGEGGYEKQQVVSWDESHAKEILVTDLDGDGTDELYVVREAHTEKKGGKTVIVDPVKISRVTENATGFDELVVAELEDDKQSRFLVAGDVTGDGEMDLVAAGMDTGLWLLEQPEEGHEMDKTLIDANSGGFEHATHLADLDDDGTLEIYVAADKQKKIRRYDWTGSNFGRKTVWEIPDNHITWNLQDGKL